MRPKDNIVKAAILGVAEYFANNNALGEYLIEDILLDAFNWDEDERDRKLRTYKARIRNIDNVFSVCIGSTQNISDTMQLEKEYIDEAFQVLKNAGYLFQFGQGFGRVLVLAGDVIAFDQYPGFSIELVHGENKVEQEDVRMGNMDFDDMTPHEIFLEYSAQFQVLANKFENAILAGANELEEARQHNEDLRKELELVKKTSWR